MKNSQKFEKLLGIVSLGKGIIDVSKFEKLHNSQVLATLILKCPTFNKRVTKVMRKSFLPKDWKENENVRKQMVVSVFGMASCKVLKKYVSLLLSIWFFSSLFVTFTS